MNPWEAPEGERAPPSGLAGVMGFLTVVGLHGSVTSILWGTTAAGVQTWLSGFGVLQLAFLVPLTAGLVWSRAPRAAVVGVFAAACAAFLANAGIWLFRGVA